MADNLLDLINATFGPAMDRDSHTPINWANLRGNNPKDQFYGLYQGAPVTRISPFPSFTVPWQGPRITVNPKLAASIPELANTLRHESVHALLDPTGEQVRRGTLEDTNYPEMVGALMAAHRGGRAPDELPAYALSHDPGVHFDPKMLEQFNQRFIDRVQAVNPKVAESLDKIRKRSVPQ